MNVKDRRIINEWAKLIESLAETIDGGEKNALRGLAATTALRNIAQNMRRAAK